MDHLWRSFAFVACTMAIHLQALVSLELLFRGHVSLSLFQGVHLERCHRMVWTHPLLKICGYYLAVHLVRLDASPAVVVSGRAWCLSLLENGLMITTNGGL